MKSKATLIAVFLISAWLGPSHSAFADGIRNGKVLIVSVPLGLIFGSVLGLALFQPESDGKKSAEKSKYDLPFGNSSISSNIECEADPKIAASASRTQASLGRCFFQKDNPVRMIEDSNRLHSRNLR